MTYKSAPARFKEKLIELAHIKSALCVLSWDKEVYMPEEGNSQRAETMAYLAGDLHEKFLSPEFSELLEEAEKLSKTDALSDEEKAMVREVSREFAREKKMPLEFVKELVQVTSVAHIHWVNAREKNDFKIFLPHLKKIVELKRKEADLVGFTHSPYDALLDTYEPHLTSEEVSLVFSDLKKFLVPFIARIKSSNIKTDPKILQGDFGIQKQEYFGKMVAEKMGFSFKAGRLDTSAHPFTIGSYPTDVRITTRYDRHNIFQSLSSIIHETGHALYEQGMLLENFGTPLGESVSLGIHESQSRVWENLVGRSRPFWNYFYPILQKEFPAPFASISFEDFYRNMNHVGPSLIRTDADEVTYNLHIILRFEIEKGLIEGNIAVEDLPAVWNQKMKESLGIDVPGDDMGVLQDIHWSHGSFGYFPTYTLGNLYSAQFYEAAKRDIFDLEPEISRGEFSHFRAWLKKNIHIHGKLYSASELVKNATGEELNSTHFINYIKKKYGELYEI